MGFIYVRFNRKSLKKSLRTVLINGVRGLIAKLSTSHSRLVFINILISRLTDGGRGRDRPFSVAKPSATERAQRNGEAEPLATTILQ